LLVGALKLFVSLGLVMIITRRIDWQRPVRRDPAV
jgi:inner membrane protein involved in colicin E2 resistance